jgi:uncharacterized phage protein (TIGR02220 family)
MLSNDESWDYTVAGIVAVMKESRDAINSALCELEDYGYLTREQVRSDNGKFSDIEYHITEKPITEKPISVNPQQINTNINKELKKENSLPKGKEDVEQSSTIPYEEIITYLNSKAGTNFRINSKDNQKYIRARWNEGFRLEDFVKVISTKVSEWKDDKKMAPYLRPSTLFGTKFESYLQQANKPQEQAKPSSKSGAVSIPAREEDKLKNSDGSYVTF